MPFISISSGPRGGSVVWEREKGEGLMRKGARWRSRGDAAPQANAPRAPLLFFSCLPSSALAAWALAARVLATADAGAPVCSRPARRAAAEAVRAAARRSIFVFFLAEALFAVDAAAPLWAGRREGGGLWVGGGGASGSALLLGGEVGATRTGQKTCSGVGLSLRARPHCSVAPRGAFFFFFRSLTSAPPPAPPHPFPLALPCPVCPITPTTPSGRNQGSRDRRLPRP